MPQTDYFLKIDTIPGESPDAKHKNEIQIESYSFSEANAGSHATGSGGGAGKVQMQDFNFSMVVNKASPRLFLACATGQHIPGAVLTVRKAGKNQEEYLIIRFKDILISSYQTSGMSESFQPVDSFSINFTEMEYEYKTQNADGTTSPGAKVRYNLKQMQSL